MKNGSLAVRIDFIVVLSAAPFKDSRYRAGCKRSEEEVVIELIKKGRMDENSPYSSIIIFGHVRTFGAAAQWVVRLVVRWFDGDFA